jgi:Na+-translocating ferredoxin:NAD+ oxidoreductase RnfD subunit
MFSKNFIRLGRHIFNPASFGLGFISIVFAQTVSWWGPSSLYPTDPKTLPLFLILLSPFLVSGIRMKRYFITFSFLSFYALGSMIFFRSTNAILNLLLDPTVIFFSLVMITEPMTSPNSRKNQILFGLFIAIFAIFGSRIIYQIPLLKTLDPLIFSLLLANLFFFKNR